jgi:site-specific DNA recombinase
VSTNPKLATGPVAIYARYSSDRQNERSNEDQLRRAREALARAGGDPATAVEFADKAVSATSMEREQFERMMRLVRAGRFSAILTEDVSRISRDFADGAAIFKELRYLQVPLIGIADGIDTSDKNAKLSFTVKSLLSDLYIDDLRDKTLRGLTGRAEAGFATGGVPFGYRTEPMFDSAGKSLGSVIVIDDKTAATVRRIFTLWAGGTSREQIAHTLNREGTPSPRAGSRHKRFGWGASSIAAMLKNEKYIGVWRFNEREWVRVPGQKRRTPRLKPAHEVRTAERPDLRIIDGELWEATRQRISQVHAKYTRNTQQGGINPRAKYLLSGIVVCDECGFPLTICGTSSRYYRCPTRQVKGTCGNRLHIREATLRARCLEAMQRTLQAPEVIREVTEQLSQDGKASAAELEVLRERLGKTEDRIRSLIGFLADGDRSEYVVTGLRDLEAQARADRAAIERLTREAQTPQRMPTPDDIAAGVRLIETQLRDNSDGARAALQRWLGGTTIRVTPDPSAPDGFQISGQVFPLGGLANAEKGNLSQPGKSGLGENYQCSGGPLETYISLIQRDFLLRPPA